MAALTETSWLLIEDRSKQPQRSFAMSSVA